jgi:hypothetical protein
MASEEHDALNREIAERLLGWTRDEWEDVDGGMNPGWRMPSGEMWTHDFTPAFAGTWEGCGRVLEVMREGGWAVLIAVKPDRQCQVDVLRPREAVHVAASSAATVPEAVAKACVQALRAEHHAR